jgi:TPR repeat protein
MRRIEAMFLRSAVFAIAISLLPGAPLQAQDTPPDTDILQAIAGQVDAVQGIDGLLAACPAAIHGTGAGWFDGMRGDGLIRSEADCAADLTLCLRACTEGAHKNACFRLGLVFQTASYAQVSEAFEITARKAFAMSCAMGYAAGCTNRAAGLVNFPLAADALSQEPLATREACGFASFTSACNEGDSWGCTMLGLAYAEGKAVARDEGLARDALKKACLLANDPSFEACVYAREIEAMLGGN